MKESYEKPEVTSESVFETLAAGCTMFDLADENCNPATSPDFGIQNTPVG